MSIRDRGFASMDPDTQKRIAKKGGTQGGKATLKIHGSKFFRKIGLLGGKTTAKRGIDFYRNIGKLGGEATAKKGTKFYQSIGRLGGQASRKVSPI